jgi:hypothetical protein
LRAEREARRSDTYFGRKARHVEPAQLKEVRNLESAVHDRMGNSGRGCITNEQEFRHALINGASCLAWADVLWDAHELTACDAVLGYPVEVVGELYRRAFDGFERVAEYSSAQPSPIMEVLKWWAHAQQAAAAENLDAIGPALKKKLDGREHEKWANAMRGERLARDWRGWMKQHFEDRIAPGCRNMRKLAKGSPGAARLLYYWTKYASLVDERQMSEPLKLWPLTPHMKKIVNEQGGKESIETSLGSRVSLQTRALLVDVLARVVKD